MKIDNRLIFLIIPPVIALIFCSLSSFMLPKNTGFIPEQPEFLHYVDKLSVFTVQGEKEKQTFEYKDVFRHEWIGLPPLESLALLHNTGGATKSLASPVSVTMIVASGKESYCIVNDRKMGVGDKADDFRVTSIEKDQVTLTFKNGTRETHHVKVY